MRIDASARQALAAMVDGDTLRTMLAALRRLLKVTPINTVAPRRRLADATVERGGISASRRQDGLDGRVGQDGRDGLDGRVGSARRVVQGFSPALAGLTGLPAFAALSLISAAACTQQAARRTEGLRRRRSPPSGRRRTRRSPRGDDPIPKAKHAQFLPLGLLPDRSGLQRAGGAQADRRQDDLRDADVDRREPEDAARRHRWSSRSRGSR